MDEMGTPGEGTRHAGLLYRARAIPNPKPEDRRPKKGEEHPKSNT